MADGNPIVDEAGRRAEATDSSLTGAGLAEDAHDLATRIAGGDWTEGLVSLLSVGLEARAFLADPLAKLTSMGLGWVIEHLWPLPEALDFVTGDDDQLSRLATTWGGIRDELGQAARDLTTWCGTDTAPWSGPATARYQRFCADRANLYTAAADAAGGVAQTVGICKGIMAVVRTIIRDLITDCVGKIISILARYPPPTTPAGLLEVVSAAAQTGGKIMNWVHKLRKAFANAGRICQQSSAMFRALHRAFGSAKRSVVPLGAASGSVFRMARDAGAGLTEAAARSGGFARKFADRAGENLAETMARDAATVVPEIPKGLGGTIKEGVGDIAKDLPEKTATEGAKEVAKQSAEDDHVRLYDGPGPYRVTGTL